jgi:thiol-disulfide isomerase/thioredoxin
MALMYSILDNKNMDCPDFNCLATDNKYYGLKDFENKSVLCFLFICNHCPYVKAIEDRIITLNKELVNESVAFIGVCSNDSSDYPEDSFIEIQNRWKQKNYNFTYLYDENQNIAKKFGAICTPDIFLFNQTRNLVYRGRFDDSWKNPSLVKKQELKIAILDTLNKKPLSFEPLPSMGCSIKWK